MLVLRDLKMTSYLQKSKNEWAGESSSTESENTTLYVLYHFYLFLYSS